MVELIRGGCWRDRDKGSEEIGRWEIREKEYFFDII